MNLSVSSSKEKEARAAVLNHPRPHPPQKEVVKAERGRSLRLRPKQSEAAMNNPFAAFSVVVAQPGQSEIEDGVEGGAE